MFNEKEELVDDVDWDYVLKALPAALKEGYEPKSYYVFNITLRKLKRIKRYLRRDNKRPNGTKRKKRK